MDDVRLKVLQAIERFENAARAWEAARQKFNEAQALLDRTMQVKEDAEGLLAGIIRDYGDGRGTKPLINNGVVYHVDLSLGVLKPQLRRLVPEAIR